MNSTRWICACATLMALASNACNDKERAAAGPSSSGVAPSSLSAVSPASSNDGRAAGATGSSKLELLVQAEGEIVATGANDRGLFAGTQTGIAISGGKLVELPELARGLEHARWTERELVGSDPTVVAFAGKRDPKNLQLGDRMMYMEDAEIGADRTVFRAFQRGAWVRVAAVGEGEKLGGFGRFQDRIVAAIEMASGKDYRFALIAGKPGIALPAPSAADKPKTEEAPSEPASGATATEAANADAGAAPEPAPSASAGPTILPSATVAEKPLDPNVPHPDPASECATRLLPRAFDGLSSGEAMLVGRVCPGTGEYWVEHWAAKKRKAGFERIPSPPNDSLLLAMTAEGSALIAALGSDWLIERATNGVWKRLDLPASGAIEQLSASPGGRAWLVLSGRVFQRAGAGAFRELPLPKGKRATRVFPSDGDEPFVVAGSELLGPAAAFAGKVVSLAGAATDLCREPYVIAHSNIKRTKKYPEVISKIRNSKVPITAIVFGHRGMAGIDSIQAKLSDMKSARELAKALGKAEIVCGAPRTEAPVPEG